MLRRPCRLKQPSGKARRRQQVGVKLFRPREEFNHRVERSGEGKKHRKICRGRASADPDRKTHHKGECGKGCKRRQADIGRPSAATEDEGHLGRTEMPKIIIYQARLMAGLAEKGVFRRQTEADHVVDHRDHGL